MARPGIQSTRRQIRVVLSRPPEARYSLSGLKARAITPPLCPVSGDKFAQQVFAERTPTGPQPHCPHGLEEHWLRSALAEFLQHGRCDLKGQAPLGHRLGQLLAVSSSGHQLLQFVSCEGILG
jgi:hypothetical protein